MKNVVNTVVANDLCIGCGLCTYKNEEVLEMGWNSEGFLVPKLIEGAGTSPKFDLEVCPFNLNPEKNVRSENEIADIFLADAPAHHARIGRYTNLYAGFSTKFRKSSSSGGIATFVFYNLLEEGEVDHVISIRETTRNFYEYSITSSKEDLLGTSKTRYFPVTLATILPEIEKLEGTVAVAGVGCFVKALRLAQYYHPDLKNKIKFLIGIICGGVKSSFFTEYLAAKTGVENGEFRKPEYRVKDFSSTASDYSFRCTELPTHVEKQVKMRAVGDMWGTGLFKANACDFCDDVTTELADISLGDAWLQPYVQDGAGTSVIVTRSLKAESLIRRAVEKQTLNLDILELDDFLRSQKGSFNHRQDAQPYRIKKAEKSGLLLPPKRFCVDEITFMNKIVQNYRRKSRITSLENWKKYSTAQGFDRSMKITLYLLKVVTKINHKVRNLIKK